MIPFESLSMVKNVWLVRHYCPPPHIEPNVFDCLEIMLNKMFYEKDFYNFLSRSFLST